MHLLQKASFAAEKSRLVALMEKQLKELTNKVAVDLVAANKKCAGHPGLPTLGSPRFSHNAFPWLPSSTPLNSSPAPPRYEAVEAMRKRLELDFGTHKREAISRIATLESQVRRAHQQQQCLLSL